MSSTADTSYKNTGGRQTKFASIPDPPEDASPELKKWMAAIKETVEVREGKRGNSLDRSIIVRDLFDPAFTNKYWPGSGSANGNTTADGSGGGGGAGQTDTTPPGVPLNFALDASSPTENVLSWQNPTDSDLSHIEIYAAHIAGINYWSADGAYADDDLVRYSEDGYVYKVIEVDPYDNGVTRLPVGLKPDDPEYGYNGSVVPCWARQAYPYIKVSKAGAKAFPSPPSVKWIHKLTDEALSHDWYYWARAVDDSANKSAWTPNGNGEGLLAIAKTNLGITPTPTGLSICETGSTTEFNNLDVNLCWSPTTKPGVKDYLIEVLNSDDGSRRRMSELIRGYRWTYAYSENKLDGGGTPEDALTIRLWAQADDSVKSEDYDEITITNPPPDPTIITATGIMQGVRFEWEPSLAPDFSHYMYRTRVETGVWTNWKETSVSIVDRFLTEAENAAYTGEAQIYIEVYVVDTWGNVSSTATTNAQSVSFIVKPHNIDDFAVNASNIWINLPILEGDIFYADSPSPGYVRWNAHRLYLNGVKYDINAGSTNSKYIYWLKPNTTYSTSANNPAGGEKEGTTYPDLLSTGQDGIGHVIAVNIDGQYDMAWNAIANQVIGSAYIEDASIVSANIGELQVNNAHVYGDLDASKIISGLLQSQNWSATVGSRFSLNDGTFKLGGSSDPALEWDGSTLSLKGAIFQTDGGSYPVPVYRGTYSSGTQYYVADLVVYDGGSWICIQDVIGVTPSSEVPGTNYWDVYAAKGEAGDQGDDGDAGPGVAYRGEWLPDEDYIGTTLIRDVVKYAGYFYQCKTSHSQAGYSWTGCSGYGAIGAGATDSTIYPSSSPALCHKVYLRFTGTGSYADLTVALYYEGGWHNIADKTLAMNSNLYFDVGGTKSVSQIRITNNHTSTITITDLQLSYASPGNVPSARADRWETFGATFSSVATDLLLANDITVLRTITFGDAQTQLGAIHSYGKSSYADTESGFYIGWDNGTPKVNIGDADKYIKWTGSTLAVGGDIIATGNIQGHAISQMQVDTNSSLYTALSFLQTWVILCEISMTVEDSQSSGVLLTGSTVVYGLSGHRPIFIQWVDETPGVGTPTYQLGIYQYSGGITVFAIGKWGSIIAQQTVEDVTGVCPSGYNNKSILTGLHIKR